MLSRTSLSNSQGTDGGPANCAENYWHNADEKTRWVLDKKRFVSKNENVKSNIKIIEITCDDKKYNPNIKGNQ